MADLDLELRELGRELAFPPTPDLAAKVRAKLEAAPRSSPRTRLLRPSRRTIAIALAVVAVAVGIAFAVPPARTAILRVFGVGGVRIRLVDKLPERRLDGARIFGTPVTLAEARRRLDFSLEVPSVDGFDTPDHVYVSRALPGGVVFLVYGSVQRPRALLTAFTTSGFPYAEKSAGPGTTYRPVRVDGQPAAWLAGAPHQFAFRDRGGVFHTGTLRLATNTLLWRIEYVTYRLEGDLSLDQAVRIAESLR